MSCCTRSNTFSRRLDFGCYTLQYLVGPFAGLDKILRHNQFAVLRASLHVVAKQMMLVYFLLKLVMLHCIIFSITPMDMPCSQSYALHAMIKQICNLCFLSRIHNNMISGTHMYKCKTNMGNQTFQCNAMLLNFNWINTISKLLNAIA
jgi:hypothetical protein